MRCCGRCGRCDRCDRCDRCGRCSADIVSSIVWAVFLYIRTEVAHDTVTNTVAFGIVQSGMKKRKRVMYDLDSLFSNTEHHTASLTLPHTHTIYDTVRLQFQERLKLLLKQSHPPSANSLVDTHSGTGSSCPTKSFLGILHATGVPIIHSHTKAFEESMMRPPSGDETPCQMHAQCECMLLYTHHPSDPVCGFVGVAIPHETLCLLCLRRKYTQTFFHNLTLDRHSKDPIHSYYNLIGPGEYNTESCLWPNGCNGITGPIVFHSRSNYYYSKDSTMIHQHINVNFHPASSSTNLNSTSM